MCDSPNSRSTFSVVIAEDHRVLRQSLRGAIESSNLAEVIAETGRADETIETVKKLNPDLLVLDLGLPDRNGLEALRDLRNSQVATRVLVLSMHQDEAQVRRAMQAGADGYLVKDCDFQEFANAAKNVVKGCSYLPARYAHLKDDFNGHTSKHTEQPDQEFDPLALLSPREREVFFMLANGLPNREIAKNLKISARTIETHRTRILNKLDLDSTSSIVRFAIRNNLISA